MFRPADRFQLSIILRTGPQTHNESEKFGLLAIILLLLNRRFSHLFKWASSGQCFSTTYNMQLTNNNKQ